MSLLQNLQHAYDSPAVGRLVSGPTSHGPRQQATASACCVVRATRVGRVGDLVFFFIRN